MSKIALFVVGAAVVIVVLYRRGLARKQAAEQLELQDVTGMGGRVLPVSEVLIGGTTNTATRVSTTITREAYDALPKAKVVNITTGEVIQTAQVGNNRRTPSDGAYPPVDGRTVAERRAEVAAMMPVVNSSPTATRGMYRRSTS